MAPIIIQPNAFKQAFLDVVGSPTQQDQLVANWGKAGLFRTAMVKHPNSVLNEVASKLNLAGYGEYYLVDMVFYEKKDRKHFPDYTVYAEYLAAVIEVENAIGDPMGLSGTFVEMHKLTMYNCPLKVLITYPGKHNGQEFLRGYAEICSSADIFNDFSTLRKHLVVYGYLRPDGSIDWTFHLYENGGFVSI